MNWLRWPLMWRSTHEQLLTAARYDGKLLYKSGIAKGKAAKVAAGDLNAQSDHRAKIIAGDDVQAARLYSEAVRKNFREFKLATARAIQVIRRTMKVSDQAEWMLSELEMMGAVAPDDLDGLQRAGGRFAVDPVPTLTKIAPKPVEDVVAFGMRQDTKLVLESTPAFRTPAFVAGVDREMFDLYTGSAGHDR